MSWSAPSKSARHPARDEMRKPGLPARLMRAILSGGLVSTW
ncbi:hypothetical protein BM28_A2101 [Brucella melitensis M28]|nr:hypothetical protein BM28_A2101 [Brucella melitensis M28]